MYKFTAVQNLHKTDSVAGVRFCNWSCDAILVIGYVWNVMAHAQNQDFVFRWNGWVHLNRRGRQFSRLLAGELCTSACRVLHCLCKPVFCSHVTLTGYPLHSLFSPSLLLPCITVCHHNSTGLYQSTEHELLCISSNILQLHYMFWSNLDHHQVY